MSCWPNAASPPPTNDCPGCIRDPGSGADEPGADLVAAHLDSAVLGAANLAELIGTLVDADIDVSRVRELLAASRVAIDVATRPSLDL
jgi:hypothetical protein